MFGCSKEHHGFCEKAYAIYFGIKLDNEDKSWAPHKVCRACVENLRLWAVVKRKDLIFDISMIFREPANHGDDCYFCLVNVAGFSSKNKFKINYPNISLSIRPTHHSDCIPVPTFTSLTQSFVETDSCKSENSSIENDDYYPSLEQEKLAVLIKQGFLKNLRRDLSLPKDSAELLGSRLHHNNLLAPLETHFHFTDEERKIWFRTSAWKIHLCCVMT